MNRFLTFLLMASACAFGQGQLTQWYQLNPLVARAGTTMTIRTCIRSTTITRVSLESVVPNRPVIANLTAQGGCFWQGTFTAPVPSIDDIFRPEFAFMRIYTGNTLTETINVFADVITNDVPLLSVTSLASDAQRTDYVVNLVAPSVFPADNTALFNPNMQAATRRFYELMPDSFDQINIVLARGFIFNRNHTVVRQNVQGIGATNTPADSAWGNTTRLLGVNMFPLPTAFDGAERTQSHEAMHQFINHISTGLAAGPAHWPTSSMASGVMGTNTGEFNCFLRLENGSLTVSPGADDPKLFNPLDLYMMGAIPANQVPDQYVVTDSNVAAELRNSCNHAPIPSSQFQTLRIADLVTQLGARFPDSNSAAKSHRIATILVSDRLLNQEEMSLYSFFARRAEERGTMLTKTGFGFAFSNPMWAASGGKFSLSTRLTDAVLPFIDYGGVVSVAFTKDTSPGGIVSIFGSNLAAGTSTADRYPLPPTLQGARVFVNGSVAPLYYVSPTQINFQMPAAVIPSATQGLVTVRVETAAGPSNIAYVSAKAVAPAVLFYGDRKTVAVDLNYQVITTSNPARHNSFVAVYFTGAGPTNPPVATAAAAPSAAPLAACTANLTAEIGGVVVTPAFCGLAPGFGGLGQLNFQIPASAGTGEVKFRILGGNVPSNETFLAIAP